jgi:hypothetical protein
LDSLKDSSIFWGNLWNEAGRLRCGELHKVKTACCLKFKMAIKQALTDYERKCDDELHDPFIRKEPTEFRKCWTQRFLHSVSSNQPLHVNGFRDNNNIANEFAKYFSQVNFDYSCDGQSNQEFLAACSGNHCSRNSYDIDCISVELVDK